MSDRWYSQVTRYQWLVLILASAGWMFDVFEGQLFALTRGQLVPEVLGVGLDHPAVKQYGDLFFGVFLLGGTLGGLVFGSLADRWGRRPVMMITILMYSVFSGLTFFARTGVHVAALRFLVAVGVGGEWAVAAALVAEVFPPKARTHASSIFHASSVFGTWLATAAATAVGVHWRLAYLFGVLPAALVVAVRSRVKEPETWAKAEQQATRGEPVRLGSFRELLTNVRWRKRAVLGMLLAAVGLGTFWSVTVAGQGLAAELLIRTGTPRAEALERAKTAYGYIQTAGAGVGLFAFGPLAARLGRRRAFTLVQAAALAITPLTCFAPQRYWQLLLLLPAFGFFTLSMHAGFAVYFPELFPTHLRGTGAGFCFNGGRVLAAAMLLFSGWLKARPGMDLRVAVASLASLFAVGIALVWFLPETKGRPLPEE